MLDIAREAGVAVGTVSRVVNQNPTVADDVRHRVLTAIRKTGWQPNVIARSMRTAATRTIGCVLPNFANPLFSLALKGIEQRLSQRGYSLLISSSDYEPATDVRLVQLMAQRRIDGLIYSPSSEHADAILNAIRSLATSVPIVLLERELDLTMDTVISDQEYGVCRAAEHLIALGHRRIALVTGSAESNPGKSRYAGFLRAHAQAGLEPDPGLVRLGRYTADYACRELGSLLSLPEPPTALISGGHMMLAGILRGLETSRRRVPEDLSVIAIGETDLTEFAAPSFTTVRWDLKTMGRDAADLLLERIEDGQPRGREARRITVQPEIVLRRSCAAPPALRGPAS